MALKLSDLWFTYKAKRKMREWDLSESEVLRTINSGTIVASKVSGATSKVLTIGSRKVGAMYKPKTNRLYTVVSCWGMKKT